MTRGNSDSLVLVDSSGWVQLLRKRGDAAVRDRVRAVLEDGRAAWCELVRVELWRGAGGDEDRLHLKTLEAEVPSLELSQKVWDFSCDLAQMCRRKGKPVPTTDLLIFACARIHDVPLLYRDRHFDTLASLCKS